MRNFNLISSNHLLSMYVLLKRNLNCSSSSTTSNLLYSSMYIVHIFICIPFCLSTYSKMKLRFTNLCYNIFSREIFHCGVDCSKCLYSLNMNESQTDDMIRCTISFYFTSSSLCQYLHTFIFYWNNVWLSHIELIWLAWELITVIKFTLTR